MTRTILTVAAAALVLLGLGVQTMTAQTTAPAFADHPMPYRILWTWDSWLCDPDSADSYVAEYRRLIDFCAEWGYNGIIVWGFLDERHGGEDAAREVARYATEKGVRILPGVGAGGYEGFVISRGHRFNLPTFLKDHPELRAIPRNSSEPSGELLALYEDASLEWLREGADWLAEEFAIGGVNIETNESDGIDTSPSAAAATAAEPNRLRYAASFADLARVTGPILEAVRRHRPDAWITYATYQPPWWQRQEDAHLLQEIPEDAIAQWNIEFQVNSDVAPPVKHNVGLVHAGGWSYHVSAFPSRWGFTQYRCFYPDLEPVRRFALNQQRMRMDGFVVGNVGSADMPDNEIAYIALLAFTAEPEMTVEQFSQRYLARLYGREAEPLVRELVLAQPAVHRGVENVWRGWARLMQFGDRWTQLSAASDESLAGLQAQIDLARRARAVASDAGQRRLDTILQVLEEYRAIAELSRHPDLRPLLGDKSALSKEELRPLLQRVVELADEAKLPDAIYHYRRLPERL